MKLLFWQKTKKDKYIDAITDIQILAWGSEDVKSDWI